MELVPSFMTDSVNIGRRKAAELPVSVDNLAAVDNCQTLTSWCILETDTKRNSGIRGPIVFIIRKGNSGALAISVQCRIDDRLFNRARLRSVLPRQLCSNFGRLVQNQDCVRSPVR